MVKQFLKSHFTILFMNLFRLLLTSKEFINKDIFYFYLH
jgi:hypothetical protein